MDRIIKFNQAIDGLNPKLRSVLDKIPNELKSNAKEVRIRSGRPLSVYTGVRELFIDERGKCSANYISGGVLATPEDLNECFKSLCGYSVHSYHNEICNGYITINGGHRAGICGTAVVDNGKIINLRNISSINLRIAREHGGCSKKLIESAFSDGICGLLIVGSPLSGKTTILKDLIFRLSSGLAGEYQKISVIDERSELAAMLGGVPQNKIGLCCDIFDGYSKKDGMEAAIRTMSPQIIVIDEIGSKSDAESIQGCLNAGVKVIATVHAANALELSKRKHIMDTIATGAFDKIAFLSGSSAPTQIKSVITPEELYYEINRYSCNSNNGGIPRNNGVA